MRDAFTIGKENLAQLQRKLGRPPKRRLIPGYVKSLIKQSGLKHDPRRRYFELLAACALLKRESLYNNYKKGRSGHGSKGAKNKARK